MPDVPIHDFVWSGGPEPDVWWGHDGIDAPIWADPRPYVSSPSGLPRAVPPDDGGSRRPTTVHRDSKEAIYV